MVFTVVTGQVYRYLLTGKDEGKCFRVMSVSPEGDVVLNRIQPGPWGYFSGSILTTDTILSDPRAWKLVPEDDREQY